MSRLLPGLLLGAALIALTPACRAGEVTPSPGPWAGVAVMKGKRSYVDAPLGQVHVTTLGDGPAVVLLHQTPWFGVQYATAQPLIAKAGFKAITVDTPGFGLSTVPDHVPTIEEYADNLVAVLDRLGLKKAAFVGHHTGSSIAAAFAARHPDRTACVAMHGVPLYTPEERAGRLKTQVHNDTSVKQDGSNITKRWADVAKVLGVSSVSAESLQWSVLSFELAGETEWYGHQAAFTFDMEAALKAIKAPTLVLSNTADSLHQSNLRAVKLRPDFGYHEWAGGSSHMMYDTPQIWTDGIVGFLREKCRG